MNVARLDIGKLFTQSMRRGHPCTLDTFLVIYDFGQFANRVVLHGFTFVPDGWILQFIYLYILGISEQNS